VVASRILVIDSDSDDKRHLNKFCHFIPSSKAKTLLETASNRIETAMQQLSPREGRPHSRLRCLFYSPMNEKFERPAIGASIVAAGASPSAAYKPILIYLQSIPAYCQTIRMGCARIGPSPARRHERTGNGRGPLYRRQDLHYCAATRSWAGPHPS
jgi:hypothetical protein